MLDIKAIRDDPEPFRKGLARRNLADAVDALLAADERRRALISRAEALRTEQNAASKAIGGAQGDEKQQLIEAVGKVSAELKMVEPELEAAETDLTALLAKTPNIPHESAPDGFTDEDALEVRRHGEPRRSTSSRATTWRWANSSVCSTSNGRSAHRGRGSCI